MDAVQIGVVGRSLPQAVGDGIPRPARFGRYGEQYIYNMVPTKHVLSDEGQYFVASDTAGRATAAAPTAFSFTAPLLVLTNTDAPGNPSARRMHIDYIRATETAAGTAGVSFNLQIVLDNVARYASGGNAFVINNTNMDSGVHSIATGFTFPVGVAATTSQRAICNNTVVMATQSAVIGVNSQWTMFFGGDVGGLSNGSGGVGVTSAVTGPPVTVGPGQCLIVPFLITSQSAASSWQVEMGWWER